MMDMIKFDFNRIPRLGVGLSHRNEITEKILVHSGKIDFLEVIASRFNSGSRQHFSETVSKYPIVLHELDLSLGTDEPLPDSELERLTKSATEFNAYWVSDHLCMTKAGDYRLEHLTPVVYSEYILNLICDKIRRIQKATGKPFLIENITYFFQIPGSEMDECTFFNRLFEISESFMLLDINNLFVNSQNFNFNPFEYIERIAEERIVEVHIGGSFHENGIWVDSHGHPVPSEVWDLLEFLVRRHAIKAVVLERDQNLIDFNEIISELDIAKSICQFKSIIQ
jgi:uncharacterized protein